VSKAILALFLGLLVGYLVSEYRFRAFVAERYTTAGRADALPRSQYWFPPMPPAASSPAPINPVPPHAKWNPVAPTSAPWGRDWVTPIQHVAPHAHTVATTPSDCGEFRVACGEVQRVLALDVAGQNAWIARNCAGWHYYDGCDAVLDALAPATTKE